MDSDECKAGSLLPPTLSSHQDPGDISKSLRDESDQASPNLSQPFTLNSDSVESAKLDAIRENMDVNVDDEQEKEEEGEQEQAEGDETSEIQSSDDVIDPFSYLQRGDFSSEIFKIELSNLPRRFGIGVSSIV